MIIEKIFRRTLLQKVFFSLEKIKNYGEIKLKFNLKILKKIHIKMLIFQVLTIRTKEVYFKCI